MQLRPTTDAAKETMFNILENHFSFGELSVLDLFSGTGNIAYEFYSRGSSDILAIDNNFNSVKFIKETVIDLQMEGLKMIKSDVFEYLKKCDRDFDIIFADPPYDHKDICLLPGLVLDNNLLKRNGWFILEHSHRFDFSEIMYYSEKRRIGNVNFSIFRP